MAGERAAEKEKIVGHTSAVGGGADYCTGEWELDRNLRCHDPAHKATGRISCGSQPYGGRSLPQSALCVRDMLMRCVLA